MPPELPATDSPPKEKHPKQLIVDHNSPANMVLMDRGRTNTLWSFNEKDGYRQGDTYVDGSATQSNYTTLLAAQDYARRETRPLGNVYFETDKTDLATADSRDTLRSANTNDAPSYIHIKAMEIATMLTAKGNEKLEIAVIGHASKTGEHDHNQSLSDDRAHAVSTALIAEMNRIDPTGKLAARIHQTTEGDGDNRLTVQTEQENKKNRNVAIEVVTQNVTEPQRTYELVHIDKKDIDNIQRIGNGAFTMDLNGSTATGKSLKEQFAMSVPVPARGAILLETTDMSKPLEINVSAQEASDFRLLVANNKAKIAYRMNEDNSVSVTADGKAIAVLHYNAKDGLVTQENIHVGTMDASGNTREVSRDREGEANAVADKKNAIRMALLKAIDTDHSGKIDKGEVEAYAKNAALRERLGAADTNRNGAVDFQEAVTMGEKMRNGMEGPAFKSPTADADFANAVKQVGHLIAGNPEISREELVNARAMDALFKDLLDRGGFDGLKNGPLTFADVAKSFEDVVTQKTTPAPLTRSNENTPER